MNKQKCCLSSEVHPVFILGGIFRELSERGKKRPKGLRRGGESGPLKCRQQNNWWIRLIVFADNSLSWRLEKRVDGGKKKPTTDWRGLTQTL